MNLSQAEKRQLRSLGHGLKPVVIIGNAGFSDAVQQELDQALDRHELLKVRVNAGNRIEREKMIRELCRKTGATLVQAIGHVALVYRTNPVNPRITLARPVA
jgi:RNA-binding protein